MPRGPYRGAPLRLLEVPIAANLAHTGAVAELSRGRQTEGRDLVGVIGHRDQTGQRGRRDPGDAIWQRLAALGFKCVDYDGGEYLELGRARQTALNARDAKAGNTLRPLVVDGAQPGGRAAAGLRAVAGWGRRGDERTCARSRPHLTLWQTLRHPRSTLGGET